MRRRKAREVILKILFQKDFRGVDLDELFGSSSLEDQEGYIRKIVKGIEEKQEEIDKIIEKKAIGWRLERLVSVDRNILRLAIYEILFTDLPPEVAIDEALELSKKYSTERSHIFINGILDRVWKEYKTLARTER